MTLPPRHTLTFSIRFGEASFRFRLAADPSDGALLSCRPVSESAESASGEPGPEWACAVDGLRAYAAGRQTAFALPLRPEGTPFQQRVWALLREIPFGETRTYGEIARLLGQPGAARAVGQACRVNPLLVLIPCHRVCGAKGDVRGYAGGRALLQALRELENPSALCAPSR